MSGFEQAKQHFLRALEFTQSGRYAEAERDYLASLALLPDRVSTLTNLSAVQIKQGKYAEAHPHALRAVELEPTNGEAWVNLGLIDKENGRWSKALDCFRRATEVAPAYAEASWNLGLTQLVLGEFQSGWVNYESRWRLAQAATYRHAGLPEVECLDQVRGRSVLVWAEQGLGDTLQFARYIPLLVQQGARVVFEVQPALKRFLQGQVQATVVALGEASEVDLQLPLLSLPQLFGTVLPSVPALSAYLASVPDCDAIWASRIPRDTWRLQVGIACSGNAQHDKDRQRSMQLAEFAPLLPHAQCWLIQKEVRTADQNFLRQHPEIQFVGDQLVDFTDSASVVARMDAIVSVDTSLVHLAGAMGKPVHVLLAADPDWRWLLERQDSPWYPSARLHRQAKSGDWSSAIASVCNELRALAPG